MTHITKIAAVENATAIWEYDPTLEGNRVLGGSLDVIAAIRTIAIKVCLEIIILFPLIFFVKRFKHLGSVLNTSRVPSAAADLMKG
jgi:hypothetical protein